MANFRSAADHEYEKWQRSKPSKAGHWKSLYLQRLQSWVLRQSEQEAQIAGFQNEKAELNMALSKQIEHSRQLESKMKAQEQEIVHLRKDLTEYRVNLGSVSSGLTSINVANEAHFPSANEVLRRYDKLANHLMEIYDNTVYDENSGKQNMTLQLEFAGNLATILKGMWGIICPRYAQLIRDTCGCVDFTTLSIASIQKCDAHCRQYWEPLFMPIFAAEILSSSDNTEVSVVPAGVPQVDEGTSQLAHTTALALGSDQWEDIDIDPSLTGPGRKRRKENLGNGHVRVLLAAGKANNSSTKAAANRTYKVSPKA